MSGISFGMNAGTAKQWAFVGFWISVGVIGGAVAWATVFSMLLQLIKWAS